MVLTTVFDFARGERPAARVSGEETFAFDGDHLIFDSTERSCEPFLLQLAETWGSRLLVPEVWKQILPQAGLLISSALSGGDLRQRLEEAASRRCFLVREPMSMTFPLPCPDGIGTPMVGIPKSAGFYSRALGCRYTHEPEKVWLYDTEETMQKKIQLAKAVGFQGYL